MSNIHTLPDGKRQLVEQVAEGLSRASNVAAVVLGGSYASGTAREDSDIDLGIYYYEDSPFSVRDIRGIADSISTKGEPVVTEFYEWGPWVNGGAWIETDVGKVDFLYRNANQVERTIKDAQEGVSQHHYGQQPTYGFYSVSYLAETQVCVPIHDPHLLIARLKQLVAEYPPKLKASIIADSLWAAEFTLPFLRSYAATGDVYNAVGCLTRTVSYMTQALFALNERYFINDKRVIDELASFTALPSGYVERIISLLARPGETPEDLRHTAAELEEAWKSMVAIAGEAYRPKYDLFTLR
jgi:predicted nucleotidyltransferase